MMIFLVLGIVCLIILSIGVYNKYVRLKNLNQEGWSGIETYLQKRWDLIPNLVNTVKGYATHERETFDSITRARAAAMGANTLQEKEVAEKNLNQAMMNLNAVAEQYPDLKANTNFLQLQGELSALEGDIEKSRRYYNGTVRENNILVETFPSNILANMFKFTKSTFFELDNVAERIVPSIKF